MIGIGISGLLAGATITVTNLNDSGPGSLRDAIVQANDGDTVLAPPSLTGTIVLQSPLVVAKSITIFGPGLNALTLSGNNQVQVLNVAASASSTVNISGVSIALGKAPLLGGGMAVSGGAVNISNAAFTTNTATGATSSGGALYVAGGTVNLVQCVFDSNTAASGGAIEVKSGATVKVTQTSITNSTATISGGAVTNQGTLTIDRSTVNKNTASVSAGGIFNSGNLTITNSSVAFNTAPQAAGIDLSIGTANIDSSTFIVNSTAAIRSQITFTLNRSLLSGNLPDCSGCPANASLNNFIGTTEVFKVPVVGQPLSPLLVPSYSSPAANGCTEGNASGIDFLGYADPPAGQARACGYITGGVDGIYSASLVQPIGNVPANTPFNFSLQATIAGSPLMPASIKTLFNTAPGNLSINFSLTADKPFTGPNLAGANPNNGVADVVGILFPQAGPVNLTTTGQPGFTPVKFLVIATGTPARIEVNPASTNQNARINTAFQTPTVRPGDRCFGDPLAGYSRDLQCGND